MVQIGKFSLRCVPPPDLTIITRPNTVCLRGACFRFNISHHQILPWLPGATLCVSEGHVSVSISAITRSYHGYKGQHCVSQRGILPFQYLPPPFLPWLLGATLFVSDGHVSVSIIATTRSYRGYQGQRCLSQRGMFPFQYLPPPDLTVVTRGNAVCL